MARQCTTWKTKCLRYRIGLNLSSLVISVSEYRKRDANIERQKKQEKYNSILFASFIIWKLTCHVTIWRAIEKRFHPRLILLLLWWRMSMLYLKYSTCQSCCTCICASLSKHETNTRISINNKVETIFINSIIWSWWPCSYGQGHYWIIQNVSHLQA